MCAQSNLLLSFRHDLTSDSRHSTIIIKDSAHFIIQQVKKHDRKAPNIMKIKTTIRGACKDDDVATITKIVNTVAQPSTKATAQEIPRFGLLDAIKVLSHVLRDRADMRSRGLNLALPWGDYTLPSFTALDILIAHG
jgi:hypothetical protein